MSNSDLPDSRSPDESIGIHPTLAHGPDALRITAEPGPNPVWDIPKSYGIQFLVVIISVIVARVIGASMGESRRSLNDLEMRFNLGEDLGYGILTCLLAYYFGCVKYGRNLRDGLGVVKPSRRAIILSILLGFACILFFFLCKFMEYVLYPTTSTHAPIYEITRGPENKLRFAIAALIAPFVEEIYFRGFVYSTLAARWRAVSAITATTLIFTGVHYWQLGGNLASLSAVAMTSFVLTFQRHVTGSIIPGVITHWINNALVVCLMAYGGAFSFAPKTPKPRPSQTREALIRPQQPSLEEIKNDLSGRKLGIYSFRADQIKSFELTGNTATSSTVEFHATVRFFAVYDLIYVARLSIIYDKDERGYKFRRFTDNQTMRLHWSDD